MMSALDLCLAGRMGADCQSLKKGRYTKEKKKHQKSMMNRQTTSHKILQAKQKTKHHEINLFIYQSILLLLHFDGFNSISAEVGYMI